LDPELALYGTGPQRIFTRTRSDVIAAPRFVSPAYFDTIGVPVLKGRAFTNADDESSPGVAIVSRSFARRYWAQEDDAIGKQISGDGKKWISVVGVAGDVMEFGPGRQTPDEIYAPAAQVPRINTVLVRSTSEPAAAEEMMRGAIRELDPEIAVTRVITLRDARNESIGLQRLTAFLLGLFALVALSIAVSGVGGILALSVNRRIHEIAIRMTLGANPASVLALIAGQGMRQVAIGMVAGMAGAIFLTGALQGLLFEVTPTDPLTFAAVAAVLALAALIACYIPARRATRVDPAVVLRTV
jgi:putative ABC transport system permease protein